MKGLCPDCGRGAVERPLMASGLCPHHHELARHAGSRDRFDTWNDVAIPGERDAGGEGAPVSRQPRIHRRPEAVTPRGTLAIRLVSANGQVRLLGAAYRALGQPGRVALDLTQDGRAVVVTPARHPDGYAIWGVRATKSVNAARFIERCGVRGVLVIPVDLVGGALVGALPAD